MHRVWEYPLLIIRYPIILSELCSSYEQFVNDFPRNRLPQIFLKNSPESFPRSLYKLAHSAGLRQRPHYLYFWLSATASSSHRLLYSFSA